MNLNQGEISRGIPSRRLRVFDISGARSRVRGIAAAQDLDDGVLMGIPHYPHHAGERRDFLRRSLGVAACDQYFARRVGSMDAPDDLPDFRVGAGGNRAGVQDGDLALLDALGFLEARSEQPCPKSRPVRLACPATEIEEMKQIGRAHV